ncbi:unnamed protein product [Caenorhabditis brenneri]
MKKKAREVNAGLKVMISIGGWEQSGVFQEFWTKPVLIKRPAATLLNHKKLKRDMNCEKQQFSEISLMPLFYLSNTTKLTASNYSGFIWESLSVLEKNTSSHQFCRLLLKDLMKEVEFVNVLTYDYFNSVNENLIGPTTPIYGGNRENVHSTMKLITCQTGNPQKLNIVVPSYGSYWSDVYLPFNGNQVNWFTPGRYQGDTHRYESDRENQRVWFKNLKDLWMLRQGAEYRYHDESKSSYYWIPKSRAFITIEDGQSLREKVIYQNQRNIGGIAIQTIDYDDDKNTLLNVLAAEKRCTSKMENQIAYDCLDL